MEERTLLQERKDEDEIRHLQLMRDIQAVLDTDAGKRFFRWFFKQFPFIREIYTGNANTQYLAGQVAVSREVYLQLCQAYADLLIPPLLREDLNYGEVVQS